MDEQNFFNFYYIIDCYFLYNDRYHKENKRKNPLILVMLRYVINSILPVSINEQNGFSFDYQPSYSSNSQHSLSCFEDIPMDALFYS